MIKELISEVNPLHNHYRENKKTLPAYQSIEIMWDIGKILDKYLKKLNIKPHSLWRKIYGRSEGSFDNLKKSYITREFLGRCYRINRIFSEREMIRLQLGNLKSFTSFRESMPFFDNPKYKFSDSDREKLMLLLNSKMSSSKINSTIKKLQREKIGIKNDRRQRLGDYDSFKKTYVDFYNFIYNKTLEKTITHPIWVELINNEYSPSKKDDFYLVLSKNLSALCQDGLKYYDFEVPENCDELEKSFSELLKFFITRKTFKEIRRFRKVIPVERFAKLSEMLYEISKKN